MPVTSPTDREKSAGEIFYRSKLKIISDQIPSDAGQIDPADFPRVQSEYDKFFDWLLEALKAQDSTNWERVYAYFTGQREFYRTRLLKIKGIKIQYDQAVLRRDATQAQLDAVQTRIDARRTRLSRTVIALLPKSFRVNLYQPSLDDLWLDHVERLEAQGQSPKQAIITEGDKIYLAISAFFHGLIGLVEKFLLRAFQRKSGH